VTHHGVANHQANLWRNRDKPVFERAAIQLKRVILSSVHANKLIHDSAACAHKLVFRLLAEARNHRSLELFSGEVQVSQADSNFEGCGRAEASTVRDVAVNEKIRSRQRAEPLHQ
jgi:hypothetical protein